MELLLCTQNKNKINEIKEKLKSTPIKLISLLDLNDFTDLDETGKSFAENALLKAKYFGEKHQMLSIADDTGLEVKALNNRPGIYSSRYAKTDNEKIRKLLFELEDKEIRDSRFVTVIALYSPFNKKTVYFEGILNGEITKKPFGTNGFGYDPIFYIKELNKTLAEINIDQKSNISHRGIALEKMKVYLNENINNLWYTWEY